MNLTLLGLGAALVVALPTMSLAQGPEKPAVERAPLPKRGNPAAAPKAAPAAAPVRESEPPEDETGGAQGKKGQLEPAAAPVRESEPPEDESGGAQPKKGQLEPAAAPVRESEPPEDESGGAQP